MTGTCESCGREDEETIRVRRVYLVPPEGDSTDPTNPTDLKPRIEDGSEEWCPSCREQYPNAPV
ncbi:MAG: hypothetical protein ACHQDC_02590 [Acidimicrobiales bacterium]